MNSPYVIDCGTAGEHRWRVTEGFWDEILGGDVEVVVTVGDEGGESGERVSVSIEGTARVICDRCLEECELPVSFSETVDFKGEVDLEEYIFESIVLGLPFQRVHLSTNDCNPDMINRICSA